MTSRAADPRGRTISCLGCITATLLVTASLAAAQSSADEQVRDLNVAAMEAYNEMDVERAAQLLNQAHAVPGTSPPVQQVTLMNLAIVNIDGFGQDGPGGQYMLDAVCINRDLQLDPLMSTPNINAAFAWAQGQAQQGRCGPAPPAQGNGTLGDLCMMDSDCGSGLLCVDARCGAGGEGAASTTPRPTGDPFTPKKGMYFGRFAMTLGASYVTSGMPADAAPPPDIPVYTNSPMGPIFAAGNPWIPDGDSADSTGTNGAGSCPADGKPTQSPDLPSSYCVALKSSGFGAGFALRLAGGYFITDKISAALTLRIQPDAGEGTLSHTLIGGRAEYWIGQLLLSPITGSFFGGLTVGQIQHQPSSNFDRSPYVQTGPVGIHGGMAFRYSLNPRFGLYAAPEVNLLFPDFLFHLDFTLAGIEAFF